MSNRLFAGMAAVAVSLTFIAGISFVVAAEYGAGGYDTRYAAPAGSYAPNRYGVVPGPPNQPVSTARPNGWPGGQRATGQAQAPTGSRYSQVQPVAGEGRYPHTPYPQTPYPNTPNPGVPHHRMAERPQYGQQYQQPIVPQPGQGRQPDYFSQPAPPANPGLVLCENAKIMARVGSLVILYSEISAGVDEIIETNKDNIPDHQVEATRKHLLKQRLKQKIETMLIYLDAKRTIPPEGFPQIEASIEKQFESAGIKDMMKRAKVSSRAELEARLKAMGTSLEREKRNFTHNTLAKQWVREQINFDEEITHTQMLEWYQRNLAEFESPARTRWEEIKVDFSSHSSKAAARAAIAAMGNRVMRGEAFSKVAAEADGTTASEGGRRDWIEQGVLACKELDRALFGLPQGQLSPIIESPTSYYIVRVTERQQVTREPFREVQATIRGKIRQERTGKQLKAYVERLREQTPVWTIYDAEEEAAAELSRRQNPSRY